MRNKQGFTLIEMLLVISVLLLILAIFPMYLFPNHTILRNETEKLHAFLLRAQATAMKLHKQVDIHFSTASMQAGKEQYIYEQVHCTGKNFHYTPQGTISQAQTITCTLDGKSQRIVLQLGSGAMDVR